MSSPSSDRIASGAPSHAEQVYFLFVDAVPQLKSFVCRELRAYSCADDLAEDIIQDTLLSAWKNLPRFRWQSTEESLAWLKKIAKNNIINWLRRRKPDLKPLVPRRPDNSSEDRAPINEPHTSNTPSRVARRAEARAAVQAALEQLHPEERTAIELQFRQGLSREAIADKMGVSMGAVHGCLDRGKRKLRAILGRSSLYFGSG